MDIGIDLCDVLDCSEVCSACLEVDRTHRESPSALSPLHIAILCGSHAIVELLLDGKANPNATWLNSLWRMHVFSG